MDTFVLPPRKHLEDFLGEEPVHASFSRRQEKEVHKKGRSWSEEEHLAFLTGLKKLGKGRWREISRYYVPTRTSTQIASHAQKYAQRVAGATKRVSKFTKIEQQAEEAKSGSSKQGEEEQSNSLRAEAQCVSEPAGSDSISPSESSDGEGKQTRSRKRARSAHICKPTALRASESEPDLMKLADSLISLGDPSRRLRPSADSEFGVNGTSAFAPAAQVGGFQDPTPSCSSQERPGASGTDVPG